MRQCVDNRWRETLFVLHEIQSAVDLKMGLFFSLSNWEEISGGLRDSPRRRKRQHQLIEDAIKGYNRFC